MAGDSRPPHLRVVPPGQKPNAEFPYVTCACALRPVRCWECRSLDCPHTADGSNYGKGSRHGS